MATKPKAARGKVTRKEKVKRTIQKIKANLPKKVGSGMGMSPGAMGGRTKTKMPLQRLTPSQRRRRLSGMVPMTGSMMGKASKSTIKGAGASGAGMMKETFKLARKNKKSGRLNVNDLKNAKKMILSRKGK